MSSGTPPPDSGKPADDGVKNSVDSAVAELRSLVNLATIQSSLLGASNHLLTSAVRVGTPPGAVMPNPAPNPPKPTPAPTHPTPSPVPAPKPTPAPAATPSPVPTHASKPNAPPDTTGMGLVPLAQSAIGLLHAQVDNGRQLIDMARMTNQLLSEGLLGGHGTGGTGAYGGGTQEKLLRKYFGGDKQRDEFAHPQGTRLEKKPRARLRDGIGGFIKDRARRAYYGSRTARGGQIGRSLGRGLGKTIGKGAKSLGAIGEFAGKVVGAGVELVDGFLKVRKAVADYTDAQFEAAKRLSEFSGSMAAVLAVREVHDIQRATARGEATAGSAGRLEESENRRKNAELPISAAIDNAANNILAELNELMIPVIRAAEAVFYYLKEIPVIGERIARLFGGPPVGVSGFGAVGRAAVDDSARAEAVGAAMRAAAAAAAARGPVRAAPAGIDPFGGPRPGP